MRFILGLLVVSTVFLVSCTKNTDPELVLRSFINYRFQENQSRDELLDMTTGYLNDSIESMNDDSFNSFVKSASSSVKKKLTIKLKNCNESKCYITYILSYKKAGTVDKLNSVIDVKKIAEIVNIEGSWKISDVSNVKSFIDMKDSLLDVNDPKYDSIK